MLKLKDIVFVLNGKCKNVDYRRNVRGVKIDSREIQRDDIFFCFKGEKTNGINFVKESIAKGASLCVSEQEIENENIPFCKVENIMDALWKIASLYRKKFKNAMVIGITGSVGKTTVKELLFHFFKYLSLPVFASEKSYNNFIGVPLTLCKLNRNTRYLICEIGSNKKGEIAKLTTLVKPDIGILTKIGPAHLEFFHNIEGVVQEKSSMFDRMSQNGISIINENSPFVDEIKKRVKGKVILYNIEKEKYKINENGSLHLLFNQIDFHYPSGGYGFLENLLCALTLSKVLGLDLHAIKDSLKSFHIPHLRMEEKKMGNFLFVLDCYNANPISLETLLKSYKMRKGRKILILGDMLELGLHSEVYHKESAYLAKEYSISLLYTIGNWTKCTFNEAKKISLDAQHFDTLEELGKTLIKELKEGDIVLIKGSRKMEMEKILSLIGGS